MQRLLFQVLSFVLIFVLSLGFFVATMRENSLTREIETTEMSDVSLPVISCLYGGNEINVMYGYSKDLFSLGVREEITPVYEEGLMNFLLYLHGNEISSVEYEINNRVERIVLETGVASMEAIGEDGEKSRLQIKPTYLLSPETEYGLKLILTNKDGKKTYYYTTLKYLKESKFSSNFSFVQRLEKAIFTKQEASFVKSYLEPSEAMDNMSFAHVNIHSSYDVISWGGLSPTKITKPRISVVENNINSSAFLYQYMISVGSLNQNYYSVSEFFRVSANNQSTYLLAYDRRMEEIFQPEKISILKKQLKFGIGEKETDFLVSSDKTFIGFVREREVWQYDSSKNHFSKVFSFRKDGFDSDRENLNHHRVKLLRMDKNGDLYFAVYGYMNRGVYEGRNGLVIYKYHEKEKRIEELIYIPADKGYKALIHEIGRMSYFSENGFFYFIIDGSFYSYSFVKNKLERIAEKAEKDQYFILNQGKEVAWQEPEKKEIIRILHLETRESTTIKAESGKILSLFAAKDDNLIYGIARKEDRKKNKDGSDLIPCEKVVISDSLGRKLKQYEKENFYVTNVSIEENIIHLERLKKQEKELVEAEGDYILNNITKETKEVSIVDRRTEKYLTEYYLQLPQSVELKEEPTVFEEVKNTVILSETTVKFPESTSSNKRYHAVIYGSIVSSSEKPGTMIRLANEGMGYVIDSDGMIVWERGKSRYSSKSEEVDIDYADEKDTEKEAAIRLFLTAKGIYISDSDLRNEKSIIEIMNSQIEFSALDLSGITLDEALYYVSEGSPVIGETEEGLTLIIAYQSKTVTLMNVKTGQSRTIDRDEAEEMFLKAGNRFISFLG